jgi:tRNA(fMet)-specific endonuclease VapC
VGLILDSSLLIAQEREKFALSEWLRSRPPEPVAVSAITVVELWFGIEVETNAARAKRRRRWLEKLLHRMEVVPLDQAIARVQARIWAQLAQAGQIIGHYDLTVAATAIYRDWGVATFNAKEFRHVPGLDVIVPAP